MATIMTSQAEKLQQPFWAITLEEAQQLRKAKVLDATAYLLAIVKAHGAAGWKWAIDVKTFCKQWEIKERTFYRALSTLRSLKLVFWEKRDRNTISWREANLNDTNDSTKTQNPDISTAPPLVTVSMSLMTLPLPQVTLPLPQSPSLLPLVAKSQPKTFDIQGIGESPKSIPNLDQINFNFLSLKRKSEKNQNLEPEPEIKEVVETSSLEIVKPEQISVHKPINLHVGKYSGASQHWALIYDGENTPWLEPPRRERDIYFNPQFMKWHGERWRKKFEKPDIHAARADFRSSLLNCPDKIPGRWEEYEGHFGHRLSANIASHEAGISIPQSEQRLLITHQKAINPSLVSSNQLPISPDTPKLLLTALPQKVELEESSHASYAQSLPPVNKEVPQEFWEKIKQIGKPMPKGEPVKPKETELERLNQMITQPLLRNQVMAHVMSSEKYEIDFDEDGNPYQVREVDEELQF